MLGTQRVLTVISADRGEVVCERCEVAERAAARLRGLLRRRELPPGGAASRPASGCA